MDIASKLIDLLVEWCKTKQRWPLLLILLVPAYFAFFQSYYSAEFRQVFEIKGFVWLSTATVILSTFLYVFLTNHERIAYGRILDTLRRGRRVSITKPLAWRILTYKGEAGTIRTTSVVKELSLLLRGLHIHPVVIPQPESTTLPLVPRDEFVIDGVVSVLGVVLRSVIVLRDQAQALDITGRMMQGIVCSQELAESGARVTVPLKRIFDVRSLIDMHVFELSIPSELAGEQQTAITRLFLRHAVMTMLYRDRHPAGYRIARTMVDIGRFLPPTENEQIAKIYTAAAFNLATVDEDLPESLRALHVARRFASSDTTIIAMLVILSLMLNQLEDASQLISQLEEVTTDKALPCWLRADYFVSSAQPDNAIASFQDAISLEPAEEHRTTMHFNAAFAYAMAKTLSPQEQGDGIIRHLEDAIRLDDNPVYYVLKGYGWALRGNLKQFEAEFGKVAVLLKALPPERRERLKPFIENWKARSLRKLGQSSKVAENVLGTMSSPEESSDVPNLLVLAGAALDLAGVKGDSEHLAAAERYTDRVIELQPHEGEAFKYRALIYTLRGQNSVIPKERQLFGEKARENFLKSIRLGHELPESHAVLARLYEVDEDPVNAAKHRQRWLELSPDDADALAYQALTILDQTRDLREAKAHLDNIKAKSQEIGKVYRLIAAQAVGDANEVKERLPLLESVKDCLIKAIEFGDEEALTHRLLEAVLGELGLTYHASGRLEEAAEIYRTQLSVEPTSYTPNNNLAFILLEQGKYELALQHWEQALQTSPDEADANAGKAASLHFIGKDDEALVFYKIAVSLSDDFLDENVMREEYSWSDKALEAVKAFIEILKAEAV